MTAMNLNKLPCINDVLLARYMRQQDWESARDDALDSVVADAQAAPVTDDDVYELACSLEAGTINQSRMKLASLLNKLNRAEHGREAVAELIGYALLDALNENRAERAGKKFWEDQ